MLIQTSLKQSKAVGKADASKKERRKKRLTAAGKTHAASASGLGRLEAERKGRLGRFQTISTWGLLSSFSSGWIQVSLSPLATAILVFEGTTSKGGQRQLQVLSEGVSGDQPQV